MATNLDELREEPRVKRGCRRCGKKVDVRMTMGLRDTDDKYLTGRGFSYCEAHAFEVFNEIIVIAGRLPND